MATLNYTPVKADLQEMQREFAKMDATNLDVIAWTTAGTIHRCPICGNGMEQKLAEFFGHQPCTCGPEQFLAYLNTGVYSAYSLEGDQA